MAKSNKTLLTMLFLIILPNLAIAGVVSAQSTKPSPPQFTVSRHDSSTIWITIENQPFNTSSAVNALVYYYRIKGQSSQIWTEDRDYVLQSDTQNTIIPVELDTLPYKLQVQDINALDFQVQAVTGYYAVTNKSGPPALISPAPQNWHTEITFNESEHSGWSSTQTIMVSEINTEVTPNLTPQPSIPELQTALALPILAASILAALALVYFRSRKQKQN
jgi:hypothetical protein